MELKNNQVNFILEKLLRVPQVQSPVSKLYGPGTHKLSVSSVDA